MERKKTGKTKYVLSILFLIALIVVTFVVLFTKYSIKDLFSVIKEVEFKFVLIGLLMIFVYIYFEGLAMRELFKAQGINVSRRANFFYSAADYYFCYITPSCSGGQPMVLYYMKKDNLSLTNSTLVLLVNTALFKIVLVVLSIISFIFCYDLFIGNTLLMVLFILGALINVLLIVLCFLVAYKRKWVETLGLRCIFFLANHKMLRHPMTKAKKYIRKMAEYERGAQFIRAHKKEFVKSLSYNFIQRISFFSISYFVYLAFKANYTDLGGFSFMDLFATQVIIALCVDSLPLPGGVGISEYLYLLVFGIVYKTNNLDLVASAMLLTRAVNFYVPLIVTGLLVIIKQALNIIHSKEK